MKHLLRLFLLICTMQSFSVMAQPTQLPEKFSTGELRYDCGFSCAIYWAGGLREINNLYRKKDWKSLAIKINTIGLDTSYSYYGLARAAAGLGYENAARTYFDLAKSTKPYMTISGKHHMGCAPNFVLDFCKEMQMLLAESNVSSSILVAETAQSKEIDVENNSSGQSTGASKREFCEILANNVEKAVCRASELPECGAGVLKNNCFGRVENSNNIFLGEFRLNLPNGFGVEIDKSRNIIMTGQFSAGRVDGVFHSTQYSANAVMVGDMVNTINYRQADGIVVGSYRTESNRVIQQSADTARFPFDIMQFVSLYKPEKIVVAQVSQSNSCSGAGCPGVIQQGEINTQQSQPVVVQVMPSPITQDKSSLISLCKSLSNAEAKLECMENIIKQEDVGKVSIPSSTTQITQTQLIQEEYVPPQEYIVDAPLYYDNQPGVAFYPIYIDTPGSCFCVVPMRYYGGVWLGVTGELIYRGFFPYRRVEPHHRTVYLQRTLVVNGFSPHRGRFESVGGRVVVLPPVGTMHHQVVEQRRILRAPPEVSRGVNATGNVPVRREAGPAGQVPTPQTTHPRQGVQPSQHDAQPRQQPQHRNSPSSSPTQPNQTPNSGNSVVSPQQAQPSQQPAQKAAPCRESDAKQRKC